MIDSKNVISKELDIETKIRVIYKDKKDFKSFYPLNMN